MSDDNPDGEAGAPAPAALRIFICYRRADSELPAQQVYLRLREKFGEDHVFIDRKIAPADLWRQTIEGELRACSAMVVIIGDEFLERLDAHDKACRAAAERGEPPPADEMLFEIQSALARHEMKVFPLVIGARDMPPTSRLPTPIRELAARNAVIAPKMYFDTAMDKLVEGIAAAHNWVAPAAERPAAARTPRAELVRLLAGVLALALAVGALGVLGRALLWLADPGVPASAWRTEEVYWQGLRFLLATLLGGLGPFLAYWVVAEMRVRARLPFFNRQGLLTAINMFLVLYAGGMFLLLSALPGWELRPLGLVAWFEAGRAPLPLWLMYALLAGVLLLIVLGAVGLALLEPGARRLAEDQRRRRLRYMHWGGYALAALSSWFLLSVALSLEAPTPFPLVPVVGYVLLCPALSLLLAAWQLAQSYLGVRQRSWPFRVLLMLLVGLYLSCTLALYAHGPMQVIEHTVAVAGRR